MEDEWIDDGQMMDGWMMDDGQMMDRLDGWMDGLINGLGATNSSCLNYNTLW